MQRVAKGDALIVRQREIVAALARRNKDEFMARRLLQEMEELQELHVRHFERIRTMLAKSAL